MTGIAATVARDSDLASHPSVVVYDALSDLDPASMKARWNGGPLEFMAPGGVEPITFPSGLPGLRVWAAVGKNEKLLEMWRLLQPVQAAPYRQAYQRPYPVPPFNAPPPYPHLFMRYVWRVGEDVNAADSYGSGKWPGMSGLQNVNDDHTYPPPPSEQPTTFGSFECRLGYRTNADGTQTPYIYYYGLRSPNPTAYAASPGRFYNSGTPDGVPMSTGVVVPGREHCLEFELGLNSVVDTNLFIAANDPRCTTHASDADVAKAIADLGIQPQPYTVAELALLYNGRRDGVLRLWLDGAPIYEKTDVAIRGMTAVGIYAAPHVNIYQGGHGEFPKAPEHYDLGAMCVATEYIGPPKLLAHQPDTQPAGDTMVTQGQVLAAKVAALAGVEAAFAPLLVAQPEPQPDPKPDPKPDPIEPTPIPSITLELSATQAPAGTPVTATAKVNVRAGAVVRFNNENQASTLAEVAVAAADPTAALTLPAGEYVIKARLYVEGVYVAGSNDIPLSVKVGTTGTDPQPQPDPVKVPPQPVPPTGSVADAFKAAPSNSWFLLPTAAGIFEALRSEGGTNTECILPYGGPAPYDPTRERMLIVGGDHGALPKFVQFDLATDSWSVLLRPSPGSHAYEHLAVDPDTGDVYLAIIGHSDDPINGIYKWDGATFVKRWVMPVSVINLIATALVWWNGRLTWYEGNGGTVQQLDQASGKWTVVGQHPNQLGVYHNQAAVTTDGLVFGGGNDSEGHWTHNRELYLLSNDLKVTRLPDAPLRVGIENGMALSGDGFGGALLVGFGQAHRISGGSMTRVADPPAGMIDPAQPAKGSNGIMPCAIDGLGVVWPQWRRDTDPRTAAMYGFKP